MRPKVVFWILSLAFGLLGLVAFLARTPNRPNLPTPQTESAPAGNSVLLKHGKTSEKEISTPQAVKEKSAAAETTGSPDFNNISASPNARNLEHEKYVRQRKAAFYDLSMKSDPESLNVLLSELQNPDREIRMAALEAVIQFDDRSSIPRLQELAKQTEDIAERRAIEDAVGYMKLPSLSEHLEKRKAERAAFAGTNNVRITSHSRSKPALRKPAAAVQPSP